ncbi:DUF3833 domain-containing protein [Colwellia sp. MEBiC06753]
MKGFTVRTALITLLSASVFGCGSQINDYQNTTPKFSLTEYFDGPVIAWGMIQDYSQQVTRRFCVELNGQWLQNEGTLAETFYFDDGEVSYRTWQLTRSSNKYVGSAADVSGQASGETQGFAFRWQYHLTVPIDGTNYEFFLDDWMYQLDQYRVFNRTSMRKFGIELAQITLFFDKQQPLRSCEVNNAES